MGPSSGPDILLFKHFRSTWPKLHHQPQDASPLVVAPTDVLQFLRTTMDDKHPREDYLDLIHLAAIMVGLPVVSSIRRPGALNRARWIAKAIYALKIELLYRGNADALHLTGRQLKGLQRFNRFVILVYIQSWYSCSLAVDAAFNDIADSSFTGIRRRGTESFRFADDGQTLLAPFSGIGFASAILKQCT